MKNEKNVNVGTFGHVDCDKITLTDVITKSLAEKSENRFKKIYRLPLYKVNYSPTSGERARLEFVENVIVISGLLRTVEEVATNYKDFTIMDDKFVEKCTKSNHYKLNANGISIAGVSRNPHLIILNGDLNDKNLVNEDEVVDYLSSSSNNKWVKLYEDTYNKMKSSFKQLSKKD